MKLLSLLTLATCISQVLSACSSIEVRKEWREFTSDEQAAWIAAVKVSLLNHAENVNIFLVHGATSPQQLSGLNSRNIRLNYRQHNHCKLVLR
jgi:hypothetical protein